MTDDVLRLAEDFPDASYEDWVAEVERVLKGAPFDKKMFHRTYEGVTLKPIYTPQDWSAEGDPSGMPGHMPFSRAGFADGASVGGWDVRQEHAHPDLTVTNAAIRADLERGGSSVLLRLDRAGQDGQDGDAAGDLAGDGGLMVYSVADLDAALAEVDLTRTPVVMQSGGQFLLGAGLLIGVWCKRGITARAARGNFGADPLGALAATGSLPCSIDSALDQLADLVAYSAKTYPAVRSVRIDTAPYHMAGASEAQDLAAAMATGVAYLRALVDRGVAVDEACKQIAMVLPVSCDQFMGIAKLRAARKLWARIAEVAGASEGARALALEARTDDRMMTRHDPWVNMLRTTVACFSAGVGGAEAITVQPFDAALGLPDDFSRRIARNTQVMLMEETHASHVIDAGGGSWYVESLTDELAEAAWSQFRAIERAGGITEALTSGSIAEQIAATRTAREKNIDKRKDPITGISEFPNINEKPVSHPALDLAALRRAAADRLAAIRASGRGQGEVAAITSTRPGAGLLTEIVATAFEEGASLGAVAGALDRDPVSIAALPTAPLAAGFEALRDASNDHLAKTGARPKIFLANLGPIAKHTARATFSKNYFEAGGIEAVSNDGFADADACAAAFKDSGAEVAILCSADPLYGDMTPTVAPALKAAGCKKLFQAGHPGDKKDDYMAAGVDDFIFMGGPVLTTLRQTLRELGVIS